MATMLLITFAIALGITIMNFTRAQAEPLAQCPIGIGLKIMENTEGHPFFCYNQEKKGIFFTLENGANIKVRGLIINVIGENKAETFELNNANLEKSGSINGNIPYDTAASGKIRQVKIFPKVVFFDQEQICTQEAIIKEEIRPCTLTT